MRQKFITAFLSLALTCFILSFSVVFTLQFKPLYYMDMKLLAIPETAGYSPELVRENYDALISYNSLWNTGPLTFNGLAMSPEGQIHFEEVRQIFVGVQILLLVSTAVLAAGVLFKRKKRDFGFLRWGSLISITLPLVLGLLIAVNWQWFFVSFHKLFFENDYWIFDPVRDPVINILPDSFFMHCALLILGITMLLSGLSFLLWKFSKKHLPKR